MRWALWVLILSLVVMVPSILEFATRVSHRVHLPQQSVVLVTGASTGVGQALVLHLAQLGFTVFAGVRSDSGAFAKAPNVRPIIMDVTSQAHIDRTFADISTFLRDTGKSLCAVVANAGINYRMPVEFETAEEERRLFDVNYFGAVSVIRKFLPLLITHKGRVVMIGSGGAFMPLPFMSSYVATKAALWGFAGGLRTEVEPLGVAVIYIPLGAVQTKIMDNQFSNESSLKVANSNYAALDAAAKEVMKKNGAAEASDAVVPIAEVLTSQYPPCMLWTPFDANLVRFVTLLPQRLIMKLITTPWLVPA